MGETDERDGVHVRESPAEERVGEDIGEHAGERGGGDLLDGGRAGGIRRRGEEHAGLS